MREPFLLRPEITIEGLKKKASSKVSRTHEHEWVDVVDGITMRFTQSGTTTGVISMDYSVKVIGRIGLLERLLKRFKVELVKHALNEMQNGS